MTPSKRNAGEMQSGTSEGQLPDEPKAKAKKVPLAEKLESLVELETLRNVERRKNGIQGSSDWKQTLALHLAHTPVFIAKVKASPDGKTNISPMSLWAASVFLEGRFVGDQGTTWKVSSYR